MAYWCSGIMWHGKLEHTVHFLFQAIISHKNIFPFPHPYLNVSSSDNILRHAFFKSSQWKIGQQTTEKHRKQTRQITMFTIEESSQTMSEKKKRCSPLECFKKAQRRCAAYELFPLMELLVCVNSLAKCSRGTTRNAEKETQTAKRRLNPPASSIIHRQIEKQYTRSKHKWKQHTIRVDKTHTERLRRTVPEMAL